VANSVVKLWLEGEVQPSLSLSTLNDWYSVKSSDVKRFEMALKPFGGHLQSLHYCLQRCYPAHQWTGFATTTTSSSSSSSSSSTYHLQGAKLTKLRPMRAIPHYEGSQKWHLAVSRRAFFDWLATEGLDFIPHPPLDRLYYASVGLFSQVGGRHPFGNELQSINQTSYPHLWNTIANLDTQYIPCFSATPTS